MRRFDCCTKSIEKIASKSPRPSYFFTQALTLKEKIESLLSKIYPIYEDLVLATDWHHKAQHGMEFFKQTKNYSCGMKWECVSNVLISVGVKSLIDGIASKIMDHEKIRNELKKASRNSGAVGSLSSSNRIESSSSRASNINTNNLNLSSANFSATEIIDLD